MYFDFINKHICLVLLGDSNATSKQPSSENSAEYTDFANLPTTTTYGNRVKCFYEEKLITYIKSSFHLDFMNTPTRNGSPSTTNVLDVFAKIMLDKMNALGSTKDLILFGHGQAGLALDDDWEEQVIRKSDDYIEDVLTRSGSPYNSSNTIFLYYYFLGTNVESTGTYDTATFETRIKARTLRENQKLGLNLSKPNHFMFPVFPLDSTRTVKNTGMDNAIASSDHMTYFYGNTLNEFWNKIAAVGATYNQTYDPSSLPTIRSVTGSGHFNDCMVAACYAHIEWLEQMHGI